MDEETIETIYIAGPMSWRPQFNIPLFDSVTASLRQQGYTIISPAELDSEEIRAVALLSKDGAPGKITAIESYGTILGRDVTVLIDTCDAVAVLPEWATSIGARIEVSVALATGKKLYTVGLGNALWNLRRVTASLRLHEAVRDTE